MHDANEILEVAINVSCALSVGEIVVTSVKHNEAGMIRNHDTRREANEIVESSAPYSALNDRS